eukprot:TRINITY_DN7275_c0_g1_i5.p1 TRINITY_DN7275_c0_g1~~TRINITY_DN7275_c0_g1_i5.p1  ORF type:complete len:302 (+),score=38.65 TRINITY_DN7275_c0_g1_i5:378-1283(+)
MSLYTPEQVSSYLHRLGLDHHDVCDVSLATLTLLMRRHLSVVPWENLDIHYSQSHRLSVNPGDVHHNVVERKRGGYCMQNNTGFCTLLRSLGFKVYTGGARVSLMVQGKQREDGFTGLTHSVIFVLFGVDLIYVVDVGFGRNGLTQPILLADDGSSVCACCDEAHMLALAPIPGAVVSTPSWVLRHRKGIDAPWTDVYAFNTTEFFEQDYKVMSHYTSTHSDSWFTYLATCCIMLIDKDDTPIGWVTFRGPHFKRWERGVYTKEEECHNEAERARAIQTFFGIEITQEEIACIKGLPSELK